jgi:hypothetical protein
LFAAVAFDLEIEQVKTSSCLPMTGRRDNGYFDWDLLVPHLIHPVKVAIIEAMGWVQVPVSPRELDRIFDEQFGVSLVAYHMRTLAEVGAVEKVRQQSVRGALQTFYALSAPPREPVFPGLSSDS